MARSGFFETIFAGMTPSEALVRNLWVAALEETDKFEREEAQRLLDYYNRDQAAIVEHATKAAEKTFGTEVADWQWPPLNGVPRIMKRLSLAYLSPPDRKLMRGGNVLEVGSKEHDLVFGPGGLYSAIDIDRKMKEVDRYSTLLNTVHIEVVPRKGLIEWDIRLRSGVIVIEDPDDYLQFVKFAYEFNPLDPATLRARTGWVYWTKDEHKYLPTASDPVGMSLEDGSNPYAGEIPIVTVRKLAQDNYWGRFGADLVDGFEQVYLQLGNLWENAFMQTHGQALGINLGLKKGETLVTGPKNPILVEAIGKDEVAPDLRFVKPDADITIVRELIEWYVNANGLCYGLPPGSWSLDTTPESGFAKFMNNIELFEDRDDGQAMWIKVEEELFRKSRTVWNRWALENGNKQIPEDLELQVTFQPVRLPESPVDKATRYTMGIKAGITSPVRYFMEEEGLKRDEAIAKAKEIEEENSMFNAAPAADFMQQFMGGKQNQPPDQNSDEQVQE
jgi:hypothetical protein